MRTDFKFLNLCGGVYSQGNLLFTKGGKELISPIGNRVGRYDLVNSSNRASQFECLKDVACMDISEDEELLVVIDTDGRGLFVNYPAEVGLEILNFKPGTKVLKISHDGRYLAVANGREIQVWSTPPNRVMQYRSVHLLKRLNICSGDVTSITWSPCNRFLLITSEDCAVRIVPLSSEDGPAKDSFLKPHVTLAAHRCPVINAFFSLTSKCIITVSSDRSVIVWKMTDRERTVQKKKPESDDSEDEEEEEEEEEPETESNSKSYIDLCSKNWIVQTQTYLQHDARLQTVEYHAEKDLLFAGFKNGVFGIYTLGLNMGSVTAAGKMDIRCIHTLSITEQSISTVVVSPGGDWVGFGSSKLGQLLVWEWKSETYVLKQQSHYHDVNTVAFSPDGAVIASSSDDGKVKLWNGSTGFCFATFRDHQGPVSEIRFSNNNTLWSSSSDGTVRGYDLRRYRQFKVLQSPTAVQFTCLALDPSAELLVAASITDNDIYMWSTQTGQLLDVFSGHDAPVASLDFHADGSTFASASWDKSVRIWEVYGTKNAASKSGAAKITSQEVLQFNTECVQLRFSPNGKRLAIITHSGEIAIYDTEDLSNVIPVTTISVHRDVKGGWRSSETTNPFKKTTGRFFDTIDWSPDSVNLMLAGNSKWIAMYSADQGYLLQKWAVTNNRSLDGMSDVYDYRADTEAGNIHTLDLDDSDDDDAMRKVIKLPGAKRGDQGKRKATRPIARSKCVRMSPTGKEWAAATTDGLLLYSTEVDLRRFNPLQLAIDLTPAAVYGELEEERFITALLKSLKLSDRAVTARVLHAIPITEIAFVCDNVPSVCVIYFYIIL